VMVLMATASPSLLGATQTALVFPY
jgi:hypothetical protein